ncbi:MAG: zinc-binding dehydrogenase [Actinomycetia bacterium]|nr:zinc-binding dehydrogenase [Actinomycetes bacterium]
MRAVRFHRFGGPEVLRLEEIPPPAPGPGEVLLRVGACAVNHLDLDIRAGVSRRQVRLPHILGRDYAGTVVAVGADVVDFAPGDRAVVTLGWTCGRCRMCRTGRANLCRQGTLPGLDADGGYAEYALAPAVALARVPPGLDDVHAAAVPAAFGTAWHMAQLAGIAEGMWVLVHAAGSGVGSAAVQIARLMGARVVATASTEAKCARALDLGANAAVNYSRPDWAARVREITGGDGPDAVIEHIGGAVLEESLALVAPGGAVVTCGAHAGERVDLDVISFFRKEARLLGAYRATVTEYRRVLELCAEGALRPVVDSVLPLSDARRSHERVAARDVFGKIVLVP